MSKEQRKKYVAAIFEALAASSSIATLVAFAFDIKFAVCCGIILMVLIGLVCSIYAEYQTIQKTSVTIDVEQQLKLTISQGDLFAQNGIILIPVIAGISYEFLRLAGNSDNKWINLLSKPGLMLQGLTTREPDAEMAEVAIRAVEAVFDWKSYLRENFPESSGENRAETA